MASEEPAGPHIQKTTFEDLAAMLVNDYKANGRRSLNRAEDAVSHLRGFFGDSPAMERGLAKFWQSRGVKWSSVESAEHVSH